VLLHLSRVSLEPFESRGDLANDILHTLKVALRLVKTLYRSLSSVSIERNARRLLEEGPTLLRTEGERCVDNPLADNGVSALTEAALGQQFLDITQ
jgi:hypothetical protein